MPIEPDLLNEQYPESGKDDTQPPTPERVARRLLALMAVAARGLIEPYSDEQDCDTARLDILSWLDQLEIWNEFEPDELDLLHAPVGTLEPPADIDAAWKIEAVAALSWALGLYILAPYDQPVHVGELREVVRFLDPKANEIVTAARLRSVEELDVFGDQTFALHWRLNYFYAIDRNPIDFVKVAKNSRFGELNIETARLIDGDLAIREAAICAAHDDERHICNGIVTERHQAANWLAGYDEIYSQVDVST
jgi:hypothetical protein